MEKRYLFKRNNETIGPPFAKKEKALASATAVQKFDHQIGEDLVQAPSGDKKSVVYRIEEQERSHVTGPWKRTYNDTILPPIVKNDAVPARLDADGTAKPLNKIAVQLNPQNCFYGVMKHHNPELVTETGEKIKLYQN